MSFQRATDAYAAVLTEGDTSFQALTVDEIVGAAFTHGDDTKELFVRRYLWWL